MVDLPQLSKKWPPQKNPKIWTQATNSINSRGKHESYQKMKNEWLKIFIFANHIAQFGFYYLFFLFTYLLMLNSVPCPLHIEEEGAE